MTSIEHDGTEGNDRFLPGQAGDDVTNYGYGGDDTFEQGSEYATDFGGTGADTFLIQGSGSFYATDRSQTDDHATDLFRINNPVVAPSAYPSNDRIIGFIGAQDKIDLSAFHAIRSIDDLHITNTAIFNGVSSFTLTDASGLARTVEVDFAYASPESQLSAGDFTFYNPNQTLLGDENPNALSGAEGDDSIVGNGGNDTLFGDTGKDTILGGEGDDVLRGSHGNDSLDGGNGNDTLWGSEGDDTLMGGLGNDSLNGGDAQDRLFGGDGSDTLRGEDGNDKLFGGNDADTLYGGNGNDSLHGGDGNDLLKGDAGNDNLYGGIGDDSLYGGADQDSLYGQAGNDRLYGEAGNDLLVGNAGDDSLTGGDGNDTLVGGGGRDLLVGGAGADVFLFQAASETGLASARDRIQDFSHAEGDKIDLSALQAHFLGTGAFTHGGQPEVMFEYRGTTTLVDIDRNGEGHTDAQIEVSNAHLAADDFLF